MFPVKVLTAACRLSVLGRAHLRTPFSQRVLSLLRRYICARRSHAKVSVRHAVTYLRAVSFAHNTLDLVFHSSPPPVTCYYLTRVCRGGFGEAERRARVIRILWGVAPHHNKSEGFSQDPTQHPTIYRDSAQTSKCTLWLKPQPPPAIFRRKNSQNYASLDSDPRRGFFFFFIPGRLTEGIQLEHICVTHASCFGSTF